MKILIDMNLSPQWIEELEDHGGQAVHWLTVGDPRASDSIIMDWACKNGFVNLPGAYYETFLFCFNIDFTS